MARSKGLFTIGAALWSSRRILNTAPDGRQAAALAERLRPGLLTVVSARPLFPQDLGSEVVFALADDPDAVVRLRMDRSAAVSEEERAVALTEAIELGRLRATGLRALLSTFDGAGVPVVGLRPGHRDPWIALRLTDETVTAELSRIAGLVLDWRRERERLGVPVGPWSASVRIVDPAAAANCPVTDPALPTELRLTDDAVLAALRAHRTVVASFPPHREGTVPVPSDVHLSRPDEDARVFRERVSGAVARWLRTAVPGAAPEEPGAIWRLAPGRAGLLTGHVLFADGPAPKGTPGRADHAVTVTADLDGATVGDFRVLRNVRDERGRLRLPG
ncbi:hypothetical protein CFN78_16160 [Amycolatopsis antarctica]|uniref:Uncharacterized protein n=1 Tax=Amycolatopsis antarctica TaxID=1854586 RepID=A0A263D1X3_9PSEU|nr:hypothetical protein [Amycolatopsis antarctica]OZM72078.1 hypothetical protein CFN78_16160 [Amycolatopsis antarctica]